MASLIGTVKWFSYGRGYGFIRTHAGVDIFVHISAVRAIRILRTGDTVRFELKHNSHGTQAINVSLISQAPLPPPPSPYQTAPTSEPHWYQARQKIRINDLAKELVVKSKQILDLLPLVGERERKTHSSSIDPEIADNLRLHFGKEREIILPDLPDADLIEATVDFQKILDELVSRKSNLFQLSPSRFEELIAEIWDRFGFQVELTKRTRDGGYDVIAIGKKHVDLKFLIECKRYTRENKVGVNFVRALHGVALHEKATKAILATTSYFTKDAREFVKDHCWQLEGRDHDGVLDWAKHASRMVRKPGGSLWLPESEIIKPV